MATLTMEYKRTDEYRGFKHHILNDCPTLPEYLVDLAISLHLSKPLMYRDKKAVRDGMLRPKTQATFETLDDHVTVENPAVPPAPPKI